MAKHILLSLLCFLLAACTNYKLTPKPLVNKTAPLTRDTHGFPPVHTIKPGNPVRSSWHDLPLSPGDTVRIDVAESEQFSGVYQVGFDGYIQMPFIKPIKAQGSSSQTLEKKVRRAIINKHILAQDLIDVSVRIKHWAPIRISVRGAVYSPGEFIINNRDTEAAIFDTRQNTGDNAQKRFLSFSLKGAAGVLPYADMRNILVKRNNRIRRYDLSGIFTGTTTQDIPLVQGDIIVVPTLNWFQTDYIRPTRVTPPGFKLPISNTSTPVLAKGIDNSHISIPYGTRLIQAAQIGGCAGGNIVNINRYISVVSINPVTKKFNTTVTQSLRHLLRNLNDIYYNPYLTPLHGVACYDAGATNIREVFKLIADMINPIYLYRNF